MTLAQRLALVIEEAGGPKAAAAQSALPYRSLQDYAAARRTPGADAIVAICTRLRVNPQWLLLGEGRMRPEAQPSPLAAADDLREAASRYDAMREAAAHHDSGKGQARFQRLLRWQKAQREWWEAAPADDRVWMEGQLRRAFPELAEHIPPADSADGSGD